jgi:hypothetical protein
VILLPNPSKNVNLKPNALLLRVLHCCSTSLRVRGRLSCSWNELIYTSFISDRQVQMRNRRVPCARDLLQLFHLIKIHSVTVVF